MNAMIYRITKVNPPVNYFHAAMLLFRVGVSLQLMLVHGFKKVGIGVDTAEQIPNPLNLPETINEYFAIGSNLIAPVFIIIGLFTRIAALPVLAVTLTGFFVLHWNDSLLVKDVPLIYSFVFLLICILGPGKYSFDYLIQKKQL